MTQPTSVSTPATPVSVAPHAVAGELPKGCDGAASTASSTEAPSSPSSSIGSGAEAQMPLEEQVQAALAQLLSVSSAFKDLQPGKDTQVSTREETIAMMQHYLQRLDLDDIAVPESPRALSVIHVAGTKGKGSTCAMVERVLREAGYKTGLFTSPHLVSPCERFRINGQPVRDDVFLRHFHAVWDGLERTQAQSGPYPPMAWFFRFLTLLALHLFADEKVDVAILEVGLGGRLDATNVFPRPVVCGVSTLDLDHTRVLGESLDLIAYAKAGVFKQGVPAFTTPQEPLAMLMLEKCAAETHTPLTLVPSLDGFGPDGESCELGMRGDYQRTNAGLAVALAATWLGHKRGQDSAVETPTTLDFGSALEPVVRTGLKRAFWPGRAHLWADAAHYTRFYIDGAHTLRSLECCAQWFAQEATRTSGSNQRVLLFTIHHERNVAALLAPLLRQRFDRVYFCPTGSSRPSLAKVHTFSEALELAGFAHVVAKYSREQLATLDDVQGEPHAWQTTLSRIWRALKTHVAGEGQSECVIAVKDSTVDCIAELRGLADGSGKAERDEEHEHEDEDEQWKEDWSVLVTGSLYLAGEALDFLGWHE